MAAEIRQVQTKATSARGIMASKAFGDGFRDAREGKPFQYEYSTHIDTQWAYERGRILAQIYKGRLKINRAVSNGAMVAMVTAVREGVLL